jgi:hypothetical protein
MFVGCEGDLYDTRAADWSRHPLRANYERTHQNIETVADFKATLRNGAYAWPGGYPMFFITSDGGALSFGAAKSESRNIMEAIADKSNNGWRVVACDINYEDADLVCDHTGETIESAYGDRNTELYG